jgi:hypothetical protein
MTVPKTKKKKPKLPIVFEPHLLQDADNRFGIIKEIKRRYRVLVEDAGADSYQKEVLCERAVFLAVRLETMERMAAETGEFDAGIYTNMTNTLIGLLKALGLEKQFKKTVDLKSYVKDRN